MNRSEFDSTESKLRTDNFNAFQNTVHFCKISILFDEIAILQFDCNFNAVRLFKDLPKGTRIDRRIHNVTVHANVHIMDSSSEYYITILPPWPTNVRV
jgi:hypothetical protein